MNCPPSSGEIASSGALRKLRRNLRRVASSVVKDIYGNLVALSCFGTYLSFIIGSDQLFIGIFKNMRSCILHLIPVQTVKEAQELALDNIRENYLIAEKELFDTETIELHKMNIYTIFALLLVPPTAFRCYFRNFAEQSGRKLSTATKKKLEMSEMFQVLGSRVHYIPNSEVDGPEEIEMYNRDNGNSRLMSLRLEACQYVSSLLILCTESQLARK